MELRRYEELRRLFPAEPDLAMIEELAEEIARRLPTPWPREIVRPIREIIREIPGAPPEIVTPPALEVRQRVFDRDDLAVTHAYSVIETAAGGRLDELTIMSPSTNFSVLILADGVRKLSKTYTELTVIASHLEMIDAFEDAENGVYVVHIKNLRWVSDCLVSVRVTAKIIFNNIFCVYDEYLTA